MNSGRDDNSVLAVAQRRRMTAVAASALLFSVALAGCAPVEPEVSVPAASPSPAAPDSSSSTPIPTPEPLIIPGCDTLLPLSDAKNLFSPDTEIFTEDDIIPPLTDDVPEFADAASNATIAKHCIWGLPRSDGGFNLAVADITEADSAALSTALSESGFVGATEGGLTTLARTADNSLSVGSELHYLAGDLWIYVNATSADLAVDVADRGLEAMRTANPTRTY
ncbi:hypothetical protein [Salinibacterium sp. NK8237]|uniref:hypothetical protein n=1 Tax=Salinibacterium sp. NK8237 TaxID=2792038 RepID=UPI0018CF33F5|nr:hypothetical protein [Salinibacterium sp. NK8237]MBH0130371.1 hypothetical protein [Salinibacterium sp. NK8237]